ncbi:lytic transglycosylase domain-containing protein [Actinomadura livida]|uniref:Lytic transglycosylase domain-containing protein n=1 Tax=Actinomadura livida TaxID=79909 RepID=A0A7W7IA46_9ACTN|nr:MULTISPECIES: lytic transglycosylase domain-containing protein [Actinomadura]MBB4773249.1 hypothetical protein [Actinomadura catellatispora]
MRDAFVPAAQPPAAETAPQPAVAAAARAEDVKVAGADRTRAAAPAGDTLGFDAFPPGPAGAAADPRDEIASGGGHAARPAGRRAASGKRTGMRVVAVAAGAAVVIGGGAAAAFALTGGSDDDNATVKPTQQLADAAPKVDPRVLEEQRRRLAMERASRETRQYSGKGVDLRPKGEPLPTKTPEKKKDDGGSGGAAPVADPVPAGEAQQIAKKMMPSFGFTGDGEFGCLVKLWDKESGWRTNAANPTSEAYGIPQANPGSKMASAGADWRTSASTQIKWGLGYIKDRYKTPCGAWSHSQRIGWY